MLDYDKFFSALGNGGPRIAVHLRLMLVFVVVARWLRYLFIFFSYFLGCLYSCTIVNDY
jgi:hypothetical protein